MTDICQQLRDALARDVAGETPLDRLQALKEAVGKALAEMAAMPCTYDGCGDYRDHFERPDQSRGAQLVEVPLRAFCSIECKMLYYGSQDPIEALAGPAKNPEYLLREQRCTIRELNRLPDVVVITLEDLERANRALLTPTKPRH